MSFRAIASIASIFLGLLVTAALAQQFAQTAYAICTGSAFAWICRQKALPAIASVASIFVSLSSLSAVLLISMPQKASAQVIYACENPATGLLYVVAANGTCPPGWTLLSWPSAPAASSPPLFQGIMVDANGKTVGRLGAFGHDEFNTVIRQLSGTWVEIPVNVVKGFVATNNFYYWYQSSDCTSQAYLSTNMAGPGGQIGINGLVLPVQGAVVIVPPATEPSIYFAGTPSLLTIKSVRTFANDCLAVGPVSNYVGLPQSVPVSNLGLTLPFSVK